MFETSANTDLLDAAMAKAQGMIEGAVKDKTNPHFRSSYADLESVHDACRKALSDNQISITQWPVAMPDSRHLHLVTRLAHKGQWIKVESSIPVSKPDAHGFGSAMTYLRRYALCSIVGIPQVDDDGNAAVEKPKMINSPAAATKATNEIKKQTPLNHREAPKPISQVAAESQAKKITGGELQNSARGSITEKQMAAIKKEAEKRGIDLTIYLDPQLPEHLSQVEATQVWKNLVAMKG